MPAKTKTVRDITVADLEYRFRLASYWWGERWCPAVTAKDGGYQIRLLGSENRQGANLTTSYLYFRLDADGLIVESPRGLAREYNRQVRVTDIAEVATKQAEPDEAAMRIRLGY